MSAPAGLPVQFRERDLATYERIRLVLSRWDAPSPYRSFAEYRWDLAAAYRERARFWADVVDHVLDNGPHGTGLWFSALLDACQGCQAEAELYEREARESARFSQERAFGSYVDNIAAVAS